jgi:methylation protein EvaC
MTSCLVCRGELHCIISFGRMPIANGFLEPRDFADEHFFDLAAGFCTRCTMVQLVERVEPEKLFHDQYAFYSSTSVRMAAHFREFAHEVKTRYLTDRDPLVVEIGSNDGILLQHFADAGLRHLGVEPSANVAEAARQRGVETTCEFFDAALAGRIAASRGKADVLLAANVMCHIPDLHSVAAGAQVLLRPGGVLVFEDPYLGDIVERAAYDQIYDEHVFYFALSSVESLFAEHGLEVVDVAPQPVHGGSMRYTIAHKGAQRATDRVTRLRSREIEFGLARVETYERFRQNVERSREELIVLLRDLKRRGKRVVGYAATSKSTTTINYCGITPELIEFISDTTPIKQGKYSPGMHIPVRAHADFAARYPDYALLFGWNHAEEIMAKEQAFRMSGGKWIVYVPRVEVLE